MYLLRCSQGHEIPVSPQSAGGTVACPACGESQAVPTLRELRQLPRIDEGSPVIEKPAAAHLGLRVSFAALMLVALASSLVAIFAAFRWQSIPVPMTTESHIAQDQEAIAALNPLQLIEVWNQHEQHNLTQRHPFPYQMMADMRGRWKRICLGALAVTGLSVLVAAGVAAAGRRQKIAGDT